MAEAGSVGSGIYHDSKRVRCILAAPPLASIGEQVAPLLVSRVGAAEFLGQCFDDRLEMCRRQFLDFAPVVGDDAFFKDW